MEVEPSAEHRVFAKMVRQMFLALVAEGFTEQQALVIVGQVMALAVKAGESGG
jgi:hypothetical protein